MLAVEFGPLPVAAVPPFATASARAGDSGELCVECEGDESVFLVAPATSVALDGESLAGLAAGGRISGAGDATGRTIERPAGVVTAEGSVDSVLAVEAVDARDCCESSDDCDELAEFEEVVGDTAFSLLVRLASLAVLLACDDSFLRGRVSCDFECVCGETASSVERPSPTMSETGSFLPAEATTNQSERLDEQAHQKWHLRRQH